MKLSTLHKRRKRKIEYENSDQFVIDKVVKLLKQGFGAALVEVKNVKASSQGRILFTKTAPVYQTPDLETVGKMMRLMYGEPKTAQHGEIFTHTFDFTKQAVNDGSLRNVVQEIAEERDTLNSEIIE